MPFLELSDGRIFYEVYGEGRPLVLIHGAWASHEWWRMQVPEFSKHYKVITPDVRGHGKSSRLRKPVNVEKLADDLHHLLNHLEVKETALVGWSMGGMISLEYTLRHPEKVKALIMLSSRAQRRPGMIWQAYFRMLMERMSMFMDFADFEGFELSSYEELVKKEVKKMFSPETPKEVVEWAVEDLVKNRRRDYLVIVKTLAKYNALNRLKDVKVPVLIIVGDRDERTPPEYSEKMHARFPNSRLLVVKGYGHYLLLERPDIVNREILDFLRSVGYF